MRLLSIRYSGQSQRKHLLGIYVINLQQTAPNIGTSCHTVTGYKKWKLSSQWYIWDDNVEKTVDIFFCPVLILLVLSFLSKTVCGAIRIWFII